jgi:hypothetical protein
VSHINNSRVGIAGSYIIGFLLRTLKKINIFKSYPGILLAKIDNDSITILTDFPVPYDLLAEGS